MSWSRLAIEMAAIVVSILLAFGIEAWWANGQERRALAAYEELLTVQMEANAVMLRDQVDGAGEAIASLGTAVRLISPTPEVVSSDSLWALLRGGWGIGDVDVATSALETLLSLDTFEPAERPTLYGQMVRFQSLAGSLGRNAERFVDVKERTADYLRTVSPVPTFFFDDPDSGQAFPVPIDELLRDSQLEGLLKELYERQSIRQLWAFRLEVLADSIVVGLEAEAR